MVAGTAFAADSAPVTAPAPTAAVTKAAAPATGAPQVEYTYPFTDPVLSQQLSIKPMVIELFTSLDCMFCPRAEHLVSDMNNKTEAIVLVCHTDPEGPQYPIARGFCADRQSRYAESMSDGLMYTPQLVINGHIDAVGHEFSDVELGVKSALNDTLVTPSLRSSSEDGVYNLDLPNIDLGAGGSADILVVTYRKPYTVPKTMRQSMNHPDPLVRVVKQIAPVGGWNGRAKTVRVSYIPQDDDAGFVVLVQRNDGRIIAAVDAADNFLASP